ncbi:MAG: phytanoyl-CoA dioxygenase family protein [Planctomycetota bacterium]|jgi:hypothetical protein|nr:phytanoyl-CoA dioxygenase family protein [Planctomycetota bacterium]
MTPEERYLFDLNGFLHLKNVLSENELIAAQEAADRYITTPPNDLPPGFGIDGIRHINGFAFDKSLERLVFHPEIWPIVREFTAGRPKLSGGTLQVSVGNSDDHAYRLHSAREDTGPDSSHYEVRDGRIFCDNSVFFHYLSDVNPGDGGVVVLPGSHRSEFERPLNLFNNGTMEGLEEAPDGILNITPRAGDVVIITESLTHGALAWKPVDRYRAILMLRYSTQERTSSLVSEEAKSRLSPETVELVETCPETHKKRIAEKEVVTLS